MSQFPTIAFDGDGAPALTEREGHVVVFATPDGKTDAGGSALNRAMRGALKRCLEGEAFGKLEEGRGVTFAWPGGMKAESAQVIKLARSAKNRAAAIDAGASIAKSAGRKPVTVHGGSRPNIAEVAYGYALRAYDFDDHKTKKEDDDDRVASASFLVAKKDETAAAFAGLGAVAEGVHFTRDLVNEPSNTLTTTEFADRLKDLERHGLAVEVLEEEELGKLGMGALLGVGQGSESPSKVVVMEWSGGGEEKPLALVGKGVVFDTGGISLKPANNMEDMTMDMGGAGTVAGVMKAVALRKAKANVVGLVGLVENMPDGKAQRPGDVVTSMKGDTIEVINTDAEGRLVLADVLWYAQERFQPAGMIDLATLTGAVIIALGNENAGVFSNDDDLCAAFLKAAEAEKEGAWRLPMGKAYDETLKSRVADIKNVGGRAAGSITAAQFLKRFVKDDCPWIHLDIAGTASVRSGSDHAPKGATGWGVRALDRLIRDRYEG